MKIFKSVPNDSTQWRSDAPGVKAARIILPIAAILSAVSLGGGLSSFLELDLSKTIHLIIAAGLVIGAFFFDALGISSGRSVVRDFILSARGEINRGVLFWVSVSLAAVIAAAVVAGSFYASRNGIRYLVIQYRQAQTIQTVTDTTLNATIGGATDQNAAILEAKKQAYEAQRAAIVAKWDGKIDAEKAEIRRRKNQRNEDNRHYIDNLITKHEKRIAEHQAAQGAELGELASGFADEQARLLANTETLTAVTVTDAKDAAERRKEKQAEKDAADKQLSNLVSGIFSYSIILMMVIGLRLELLECRNGILPNPILSNGDLSGLEDLRRFIMALPYFLFSWVRYGSEMLYTWAAKRQPPVIDNDLIDYNASQLTVQAERKEGKVRRLIPPSERRAIGYGSATATHENPDDSKQGISYAIKGTPKTGAKLNVDDLDLWQLKQRLKDYSKRLAKHEQKAILAERKGKEPTKRTLDAIENNRQHVETIKAQINELENKPN